MNKAISLIPLLAIFTTSVTSAEIRRPHLTRGMSSQEVVKLWGAPAEIQEQEVKRQQVWNYGKGDSVTLRESKVVLWRKDGAVVEEHLTTGSGDPDPSLLGPQHAAEPANETRDLVSEIAREIPSGPDVPYSEPPSGESNPSSTTASAPPPPAVPAQPPAGMYANPPGAGFQPYVTNDED